MLFKSSASPKENPGSKRLRRTLGLLLGSALAVQYKQDRIFRASVNLQLVMVLNYLYAAYNLLIVTSYCWNSSIMLAKSRMERLIRSSL